jgi:hypothetical protein
MTRCAVRTLLRNLTSAPLDRKISCSLVRARSTCFLSPGTKFFRAAVSWECHRSYFTIFLEVSSNFPMTAFETLAWIRNGSRHLGTSNWSGQWTGDIRAFILTNALAQPRFVVLVDVTGSRWSRDLCTVREMKRGRRQV